MAGRGDADGGTRGAGHGDGAGRDHELDEIGSDRFPFVIIPLGFLVLVGIIAGLLLADRDDSGLTPVGTTPAAVTTTVDAPPAIVSTPGVIQIRR